MSIEEIVVYLVVGLAAAFSIRVFIRQFTRGESDGKCSNCATPPKKTPQTELPRHLRQDRT